MNNTVTKTKQKDTKMTRNAQYKQKVTLSSWRQIHKKPAQEKQ